MDTQSHYLIFPPSFGEPLLSIGLTSDRLFSLPSDPTTSTTSRIRKASQDPRKKQKNTPDQGVSFSTPVTIAAPGAGDKCALTASGMLPGDILLEIFDLYRKGNIIHGVAAEGRWRWHFLAHVCRRWRQVIFESPHRLNLRLFCRKETPVRKNLGVWPALPIVIDYRYSGTSIKPRGEGNVIAALRHPDRVCEVALRVPGLQLEKVASVMQVPFPVLTYLLISSNYRNPPTLPGGFMGVSAPCLQKIKLWGVSFPTLPTLLLSASDLTCLKLCEIPSTGYISPEAMVVGLAALPRLKSFDITFRSATPRPDRIRTAPHVTRTVLPALTQFHFMGASEYLENLIAHIDCPELDYVRIGYFNQLVDFQVTQLSKFIDRSVGPKLTPLRPVVVGFSSSGIWVWLPLVKQGAGFSTDIRCKGFDCQVSHMAQVLSHFSASLSNVVHLELKTEREAHPVTAMDDVEWLHLLRQSPAVQTLHVSQILARHVALALEDIRGEMVTEVLPFLDLIYLEGQPASSIEKFVAVRRLSGRPVTTFDTDTTFRERLKSFVGE